MKYFWLLLTIAFVLVIFYNSSLPATESKHLSAMLANMLTSLGNIINVQFDANLEHTIRKLAHFCEFAFLSFLLCKLFASFGVQHNLANVSVLFFGLLVAVVDEYIQLSSPGRSGAVKDILLDFSGVFTMWVSVQIWRLCK